ncbi:MAG: hypothetical protein R2932_30485 [Caldilineaceae bacterium]
MAQAKYDPLEASTFYADGKSARDLVPNTVAQGQLWDDPLLEAGLENGAPATTFPFPVTQAVLSRGQERYTIYCAPVTAAMAMVTASLLSVASPHRPHIIRIGCATCRPVISLM